MIVEQNTVKGVKTWNQKEEKEEIILGDRIILATGGKSYPTTGSTGDGYHFAQEVGHTITEIKGSLVPLECFNKEYMQNLQGISLRNVKIKLLDKTNNHIIYEDFGEMLFTHYGISGPVILSSSAHLLRYKDVDELLKNKKIVISIDLKPALTEEVLDLRIRRDFEEIKNKQFKNGLDKLLPKKMIPTIIELVKINENKQINEITKEERMKIVRQLKNLTIEIKGFRKVEEAVITAGGVSVKEINPKTMESKLIKGLFFAGEIIDVDAYTGGFNLQIAYSTGFVAGMNV
jgi:predicted Rossmann fold flavoprotein